MTTPTSTDARMMAAFIRYHRARMARSAARKAIFSYLAAAWNDQPPDEDGDGLLSPVNPNKHKYAQCGLGEYAVNGDPYDPAPILCDVCKGSQPLYQEMRRAAKEHGAALRSMQGIARALVKP
jgi:hypothetical protein